MSCLWLTRNYKNKLWVLNKIVLSYYKCETMSNWILHYRFFSVTPMSLKDHTGFESCDMTEMRIFTMARQVASALVGSNILLSVPLSLIHTHTHHQQLKLWGFFFFFFLQEYLHAQQCIHGNVGARSVLVGGDQTAKLWGLGSAYRRKTQANAPEAVEDMELKKWQAPEVLSRRSVSASSDVWVSQFGSE